MKNVIHKVPFVRLLAAFIPGLLLGSHNCISTNVLYLLLGILIVVALRLNSMNSLKLSYGSRWVQGLLIYTVFCLLGQLVYQLHERKVIAMPAEEQYYVASVLESPQLKKNAVFVIAKVRSEVQGDMGKAILYLQKDSASSKLNAGATLAIRCRFDSIPKNNVPNGFDYAGWMHGQHIVSQAWVSENQWIAVPAVNKNRMVHLKQGVKDFTFSAFHGKIDAKGCGLLMALIIGDKQFVDKEQKQRFKTAGVLHVMAVSGLHVGILYIFLSGALFFMKRKKWLRIFRSFIIWFVLFFFAYVAGLSPSVVRSVWMFFLVDVGSLTAKKSSVYNIVAASAFTVLVFDPHTIYAAGFWLSYCAVISIITFFPFARKMWSPANKFLRKIRDLIALSLSVQPGTAPLSVFLFNQFPTWFLLSNMIAVPLVGLIINFSFIVLMLNIFSVSFDWMYECLQFLLDLLDFGLTLISNFRWSVITGISLNGFELTALLTVAVLLGFFIWMQEKKVVIPMMLLLILILGSRAYHKVQSSFTSEILLFNVFGDPCIFVKNGRSGYWLDEPSGTTDNYTLEKYCAVNGIYHIQHIQDESAFLLLDSTVNSGRVSRMQFAGDDMPALIRSLNTESVLSDPSAMELKRQNQIYAALVQLSVAKKNVLILWGLSRNSDVILVDDKQVSVFCNPWDSGWRIKI